MDNNKQIVWVNPNCELSYPKNSYYSSDRITRVVDKAGWYIVDGEYVKEGQGIIGPIELYLGELLEARNGSYIMTGTPSKVDGYRGPIEAEFYEHNAGYYHHYNQHLIHSRGKEHLDIVRAIPKDEMPTFCPHCHEEI